MLSKIRYSSLSFREDNGKRRQYKTKPHFCFHWIGRGDWGSRLLQSALAFRFAGCGCQNKLFRLIKQIVLVMKTNCFAWQFNLFCQRKQVVFPDVKYAERPSACPFHDALWPRFFALDDGAARWDMAPRISVAGRLGAWQGEWMFAGFHPSSRKTKLLPGRRPGRSVLAAGVYATLLVIS